MRILILGGTGWLGGEVAEHALRRGDDVTCLARGSRSAPPAGTQFVRADRDDPNACDAVAGTPWDGVVDVSSDPQRVRAAATALAPVARFYVYVSSASVYLDDRTAGENESAPIHEPLEAGDAADPETYGPRKVACEHAVTSAFGRERSAIVRPGLIGGPGDRSDRTGYWPLRFARPAEPGRVLVPATPDLATQVIDVRDLAVWIVACLHERIAGTFDALGDSLPLAYHLELAQRVAKYRGALVPAEPSWLDAHGVQPWMGPRSLPLWLPLPECAGFGSRDGSAARAAGLTVRPLESTLADTLAWERTRTDSEPRRAGLADDDERALLRELIG